MFASLEVDYEDADNDPTGEVAAKLQQTLTFYELDLGLNHVVRKYSEPLEEHANLLISVPGRLTWLPLLFILGQDHCSTICSWFGFFH